MKPTYLIVLLFAAGIAACNKDAPKTPPPPTPKVETPKPAGGVTTAPAPAPIPSEKK